MQDGFNPLRETRCLEALKAHCQIGNRRRRARDAARCGVTSGPARFNYCAGALPHSGGHFAVRCCC